MYDVSITYHIYVPSKHEHKTSELYDKNIARNTTHTIVWWPNPKQRLIIYGDMPRPNT